MYQDYQGGLRQLGELLDIDLLPLTKRWCSIYSHRCKHRGKVDAVKFMKELNTIAERYALRQNIESSFWIRTDNDGFPRILGRMFKSFLRSKETRKIVLALSVMRSVESLNLPISKDISTIIDPCKVDNDVLRSVIDFIPTFLASNKIPVKFDSMKYHCSVKNGPNGHALMASDSDALAVMNDQPLFEAIRNVERILGDNRPMEIIKLNPIKDNNIHSKLVQFPDKSGKTRTIAVIDYYSQRCLKPLHKYVMKFLASMPSDGTHSHQNVGKFAQEITSEKKYIYCADLTAFTDRFPGEIQRVLLNELIQDPVLSDSWWTLLAKRTFTTQWSGEQVAYSCGQPMGAYASWPLCTLAHHLVVHYCAYKAQCANIHSKYRMIGDDIIISDRGVAEIYQVVIRALGVQINTGKTVVSNEASDFSGAEVAKQLYLNGICLTPITPGIMRDIRKPYMFNTCIKVLLDRYDFFSPETPSEYINRLSRGKSSKYKKLMWMLCSNPINGVVKPGNPGYDEMSPWVSVDTDESKEYYPKVILLELCKQAMNSIDKFMSYRIQGGPQKDQAHSLPCCIKHVLKDMNDQLTSILDNQDSIIFADLEDLEELVEEFDFVPNPDLPYQKRRNLRQRRSSSVIEKLYVYDDSMSFDDDW